ncbi:MAG: molybdate ABC transporter substrate-binding protein [Calditrichaceae bacterium]
MNMRKYLIPLLLLISTPAPADDLIVAASANVQFAMRELQESFQKSSGLTVTVITGSSGKLTAQIKNGAPFDIFLSADTRYPRVLYDDGYTFGEPVVYAYGSLVLWTIKEIDLSGGLSAILDDEIKKIAVANPQTAPYGVEAIKALRYFDLYDRLEARLVYGSSISQTSQFISSGAADAGITAKSVVLAPEMKTTGSWIDIPPDSYDPIAQGVVILKRGKDAPDKDALMFYNFLFSEQAREIFKKYGYRVP